MQGDTSASIDFLEKFHPEGLWVLTAIRPDRKGIETRTFGPETVDRVVEWLDKYINNRNIYFSVNPPIRAMSKKPERVDTKSLSWLHVDVDPRVGEDLNEERKRALGVLQNPPRGVPPCTSIVFSGGGYQGFWRLSEPLLIDGDLEKAEDAKRYNIQLEMVFGADNCHNIDRIMRLPGTINHPDKIKLKKGRVKTLAETVSFEELVYSIDDFTKSPATAEPVLNDRPVRQRADLDVSTVKHLESVDELDEWRVDDRVKVLIVQGSDPNEPTKYPSRSEALFDVLCQLSRAEVPDEVMFSVITDPDFRISESVLDKKSKAVRYATRQIERAKEEAHDPWLRKLNERHAVIRNWGGKCRVIEEVYDHAMKRTKLTKQSFQDFTNSYMNERVEMATLKGKPVFMEVGKWWLRNSRRRQYDTLVFLPGHEVEEAYNLWTGFSCEPVPGDCSLFLVHVRENICGGVREHYDYLLSWMARCVQKPDTQGNTAIVMRGREGTGKSLFATMFGSLWGRHFLHISDSKHLVGSFNAHLRDCVVLFGDEAFFAGDVKHEAILKTLITESTLTVEPKGIDVEVCSNFVHLLLGSNKDWVVPAGGDNRRFLMLDVSEERLQDVEYFKTIVREMNSGGREALLHTLMSHDLTGFDVRTTPKTKALRDQKIHSLNPVEEWWYQKLMKGTLLEEDGHWTRGVVAQDLMRDYVEYTRSFNISRRGNETLVNRFLELNCPEGHLVRERKMAPRYISGDDGMPVEVQRRVYHYVFPTLAKCREKWCDNHGEVDWSPEPERQLEMKTETPF